MSNRANIETEDAGELRRLIGSVNSGLVTFDGCQDVGKTTLAIEMAHEFSYPVLDLDDYLVRDQERFFDALRLNDLVHAIDVARRQCAVMLISGVCMQRVLEAIGRVSALSIYVQRKTPMGLPADLDIIDVESGVHASQAVRENFDEVDSEVYEYHDRYRPKANANLVYIWVRD